MTFCMDPPASPLILLCSFALNPPPPHIQWQDEPVREKTNPFRETPPPS
jgi:hypothetical protein